MNIGQGVSPISAKVATTGSLPAGGAGERILPQRRPLAGVSPREGARIVPIVAPGEAKRNPGSVAKKA